MTMLGYEHYVDPNAVPRISKEHARMDMFDYPPFLDRLLGMWGPLSKEPVRGISSDGHVIQGLYGLKPNAAPVASAAQAAMRWLDSLDGSARARVHFPLDSRYRFQWQNTPLLLRPDQMELLEMTHDQRERALELVRASLSSRGYERTRGIMDNNRLLGELNNLTDLLNEWSFSMAIYGTPSTSDPWGWQFFGHHLALNCFFVGGQMVLSPVFMGLEPDHDHGGTRRRAFEPHEQRALALFHGLSPSDQKAAILYRSMLTADQPEGRYHPDDGRQVGGAFQNNRVVPYEGVSVRNFNADQRRALLDLADVFIDALPDGVFGARLSEIERYLDRTHFAWIGQADEVNPFYFRIHSPVALLELDHHSGIFLANEEPARFHVHTIARAPNGGDYGVDLLRQHYARGGHDGGGAHSHDGGHTFHNHD
ncbi:DUF3500 domain-containing protein [Sphingobium sp. MK2]|uniref:DUF3500 domain-containing protein n=1 Tax=Sphingobium sp. MK2 TaxID=3116540 RepID=UPI0032E36671